MRRQRAIPVKKTKDNLNQCCWTECKKMIENGRRHGVTKSRRRHILRIGEDVFFQPCLEGRRNQRDEQKDPKSQTGTF